ncbi:hypothetical protein LJR290_007987 [Variovorax sp. LjRoot290]|uniref:hypothetical protein n=1 Tax=Variovorax sp. LjRoot290 TaxID=3342316 RepID=UPI003ED0DF72
MSETSAESGSTAEQDRWEAEFALKQREQKSREQDLELRRRQATTLSWHSPLVLAVLAAATAALGNAAVALLNGRQQVALETARSEGARMLEMIKTGDPRTAKVNLKFLLDAGLITDEKTAKALDTFLKQTPAGSFPSLPSAANPGTVSFVQTPEMTPDLQKALDATIAKFIDFMKGLGGDVGGSIAVHVLKDLEVSKGMSGYYDPAKGVFIDAKYAKEQDLILRELSHAVLATAAKRPDMPIALESGLSAYFPASFRGGPDFASGMARDAWNLRNSVKDTGPRDPSFPAETFRGLLLWGGTCWDLREAIGKEAADQLILDAWALLGASPPSVPDQGKAFKTALLTAAERKAPGRFNTAIEGVFAKRGV